MTWTEGAIFADASLVEICENIAEISAQFIVQLQEISKAPRNAIIKNYIIPWAVEAESDYSTMSEEERDHQPYFEFIDVFTERKIKETFGATALDDCPPIEIVFNQ